MSDYEKTLREDLDNLLESYPLHEVLDALGSYAKRRAACAEDCDIPWRNTAQSYDYERYWGKASQRLHELANALWLES